MRKLTLAAFICLALSLAGCETTPSHRHPTDQSANTSTTSSYLKKDPTSVAIIDKKALVKRPYRVLGQERVSRYNFAGLKRHDATLDHMMRKIAASMGGDAVIDIKMDGQQVEGTVVSFEKVLLF